MTRSFRTVLIRVGLSTPTNGRDRIMTAIEDLLDMSTDIALADRMLVMWAARELIELHDERLEVTRPFRCASAG
jgi:hypothetical protein